MDEYIFRTKTQLAKKPIEPTYLVSYKILWIEEKIEWLTGQDIHQETDQGWISNIQYRPSQPSKADSGSPENKRVHKHVKSGHTGAVEGTPWPAVIFSTEHEVDEQDCSGGSGDYHQPVAEKQESEHVVDFASPQGVHDKVELDKDCAKR